MSSSYLHYELTRTTTQWNQVDLLIEHAITLENDSPLLYEAACRSISVLIFAHLEGCLKHFFKGLVSDINSCCQFSQLPEPIQRAYCQYYLPSDHKQNHLKNLIEKFSHIGSTIKYEALLPHTENALSNKNPNCLILRKMFEPFGINYVFHILNDSQFDFVFEGASVNAINRRSEEIHKKLIESFSTVPYSPIDEEYDLNWKKVKGEDKNIETFWMQFIQQVADNRHSVAHGDFDAASESAIVLQENKAKIHLFELALLYLLCCYLQKKIKLPELFGLSRSDD